MAIFMGMKSLIKSLLKEGLDLISEIDWINQFKDVSAKKLSREEAATYLDKVISNCNRKSGEKSNLTLDMPYIHNKRITKTEEGAIDLDSFIKNITEIPKQIISKNAKMGKSSDDNSLSMNVGIPALRGLVYDKDENVFYIVNTCPGAGSCALICYARRGSYVMFPEVFVKQTRVLSLLLNHPDMFENLLYKELETEALKYPDKEINFRWNDAGDFFSKEYFNIALRITKKLKAKGYNVNSYGYTKMGDIVNLQDKDVVVNFSDDANKRETGKVKDKENVKRSVIVPQNLFDDLLVKTDGKNYAVNEKGKVIFKDGAKGIIELKNRLAKTYNVDPKTILTYDEYLKAPVGQPKQYNVAIMPKGDGDKAAQRNDVLLSFLLFH